jgi:hypothetical protein
MSGDTRGHSTIGDEFFADTPSMGKQAGFPTPEVPNELRSVVLITRRITDSNSSLAFPGFPDFQSNVTFCPLQFFTVVIPTSSRGCVRQVGHTLRRLLG